jgi:predicted transcriptional regulator
MTRPEGNLTSTQYEILEAVWEHGGHGATVAEIWQAVRARRSVGRTTILNLMDRLEKRGWLVRREKEKPSRYLAALDRGQTAALLAAGFVDDFFDGSASELVMSLLGSRRLKPDDVERLRHVLESAGEKGGPRTGQSP